jgi:ribosome-associated protein
MVRCIPRRTLTHCHVYPSKGTTLTTLHAKGTAKRSFSKSPDSGIGSARRRLELILASLEDSKAEDVITINIAGKSALGDYMVVTSGRSNRHVTAIADHLISDLKDAGEGNCRVEGLEAGDWVLIDAGDIIIHIFRPEIRAFYNIEKMWAAPDMDEGRLH